MNRFARALLLTTALVTALAAAVRTLSKGMTIMTIKTLIDQQHSDR